MSASTIHRMSNKGGPRCGAKGMVRLSTSGAFITCAECIEADRPNHEAQMAEINAAASRYRARYNVQPSQELPCGCIIGSDSQRVFVPCLTCEVAR